MKPAVSNIAWTGADDAEMYAYLRDRAIGLEVAPGRLFDDPYSDIKRAEAFGRELFGRTGIRVCSVQSVWFGETRGIFGGVRDREYLFALLCKAIDFAHALQCRNIVFGCPRNRSIPEGRDRAECRDVAREFFVRAADYACGADCVLALEPNPAIYGTNFLNTTREAFDFVKGADNPALKLNLDFGTIIANGERVDDIAAFAARINHVHISEPYLAAVRPRAEHARALRILKENGYGGCVSIEMKSGDGGTGAVKSAVRYLEELNGEI